MPSIPSICNIILSSTNHYSFFFFLSINEESCQNPTPFNIKSQPVITSTNVSFTLYHLNRPQHLVLARAEHPESSQLDESSLIDIDENEQFIIFTAQLDHTGQDQERDGPLQLLPDGRHGPRALPVKFSGLSLGDTEEETANRSIKRFLTTTATSLAAHLDILHVNDQENGPAPAPTQYPNLHRTARPARKTRKMTI